MAESTEPASRPKGAHAETPSSDDQQWDGREGDDGVDLVKPYDDGYSGDQYSGDQYSGDQHADDPYSADQHSADQHSADGQYGADQYGVDQYGAGFLTTGAPGDGRDDSEDDEPGRRGSLSVKDKVIEKMATRAALDVDGVDRHGSGFDRFTGRELPRVQVRVAGGHVRVELDIAVTWPHPLADVGATVRSAVREHLTELSGLQVDAVDVSIPTVVTESGGDGPPARRVQ